LYAHRLHTSVYSHRRDPPHGVALKQMRYFSKTADYLNERERQKQHENEDFHHCELWRNCTRGQLPEPLLRLASYARLTKVYFRVCSDTLLVIGWLQ